MKWELLGPRKGAVKNNWKANYDWAREMEQDL